MSHKKRKKPPEPPYKAWIVGHEVVSEKPLVVQFIESGGPVPIGMALGYLYRNFPIEVSDDALGMNTHGLRPRRRWSLGRAGLSFTASEMVPSKTVGLKTVMPRLLEVSARLNAARKGLNDSLRRVEQELLELWPDKVAVVELEIWRGRTYRLIWQGGLFVEQAYEDRGPEREPLPNANMRHRLLAVEALAQLKELLQAA